MNRREFLETGISVKTVGAVSVGLIRLTEPEVIPQ